MPDKAENEKPSGPAGGERRAALRSDEGGGSTRVRESSYPMRKASTLPDVSAYSTAGGVTSGETWANGKVSEAPTSDATTPNDESSEPDSSDVQFERSTEPASSAIQDQPDENDGSVVWTDTETDTDTHTDTVIVTNEIVPAGLDELGGERAEDHPTADPSSPATQQIAATPAGATAATTAGATAAAAATYSGATAARSTHSRSSHVHDDDANPDTSSLSIRPPEEDVTRRASQRDEAAAAKPLLPRLLQVAVAVFFPVILLAAAVRAVTTPLFLWVEYHRPGFPADSYGFSTEDRMTYGSYTMDYILNWAPARYLGDLVNTDGDQLFLDSEVGHMADVKGVLSTGFLVASILTILAIAACTYLARRYPGGIRRALFAGAVATLVLAVALAVAGVLAWETFFTQVHALFFADGTWTFRLDDTLIRLFPAQFWIDAAATVGAIVLMGSVLTLVFTWPTRARREKSADAYAARRANSGL